MFENDYMINGKHATYLKFLAKKNARDDDSPDNPTAAKIFELTSEERVDRAFRYDSLPEKAEEFKQSMELFNDYVRGGIEVMYEQFTDGCQTQDDYLNKTYEVMTTFKEELEGLSYEDELAKLIR